VHNLGLLDLALRIGVAAVAAMVLGFERELRGHAAGARTHALVAVGAVLFTVAGAYGFSDVPRSPSIDPARIAAQVASGVGFLGAGAILRQGLGVRGLTTAATLWLAAALGVASGAGAYPAVALGTLAVLLALVAMRLLKPLAKRWGPSTTLIELDYARGHGTLGPLLRAVNDLHGRVDHLEVVDDDEQEPDGLRHVSLRINARDLEAIYQALDTMRERPEVRSVRIDGDVPQAA
jgi:putative Mg2+ transporter-C (MgtC) family protein